MCEDFIGIIMTHNEYKISTSVETERRGEARRGRPEGEHISFESVLIVSGIKALFMRASVFQNKSPGGEERSDICGPPRHQKAQLFDCGVTRASRTLPRLFSFAGEKGTRCTAGFKEQMDLKQVEN